MADPSTHINYSFEDIQRYLEGKMSAAEMHTIEKAALQDAFLADAIEGYNDADLAKAKQHLNEINASLFAEKQKSKVVAFNKKTQWLNIAAMLIIICGLGVLSIYLIKHSGKQQQVAQVKNQLQKPGVFKDSSATINTFSASQDSASLINQDKYVQKSPARKFSNSSKKEINADAISNEAINAESDVATISAAPSANKNVSRSFAPVSINKQNDSLQKELMGKVSGLSVAENTFSGKIVDENNNPVAYATVESKDKKTATVTNASGDFTIQNNDSVMNVTATTVGFESRNINLRSGNNAPIVLKATNTNLNEVVTVGYGAARKSKVISDSVMPIGGWQNFNNYVITQLNKDTTEHPIASPNDVVEIEFLVDNLGNPYNIKIIKSPDETKTAKAIEILKNGPKWSRATKKKKAKLSIAF
ncbi:MAG: carboxypeptidase-like regulatory domain-containing protein [Parafilimonas sp.]